MPVAQTLRSRGWMLALALAAALPAAAHAQPQPVLGTHVVLQPPAGFVPGERFTGFQREDLEAAIMVTEMAAPYAEMDSLLTGERLREAGMVLRSDEPFTVDGEPGRVIAVSQEVDGLPFHKWMLMFGNDSSTTMVVATYPESTADSLSEAMRLAVMSARQVTIHSRDPFEGLPFRVAEGPRLRFADRMSHALALNETGTLPNPEIGSPFLIVGLSTSEVDLGDVETFAQTRLRQISTLAEIGTVTGGPVTIDGAQGWELLADAVHVEEVPIKVYQVILSEGGHYILIQAFVDAERADSFIPEFRTIARSLRRTRAPQTGG